MMLGNEKKTKSKDKNRRVLISATSLISEILGKSRFLDLRTFDPDLLSKGGHAYSTYSVTVTGGPFAFT